MSFIMYLLIFVALLTSNISMHLLRFHYTPRLSLHVLLTYVRLTIHWNMYLSCVSCTSSFHYTWPREREIATAAYGLVVCRYGNHFITYPWKMCVFRRPDIICHQSLSYGSVCDVMREYCTDTDAEAYTLSEYRVLRSLNIISSLDKLVKKATDLYVN